MNAVIRYACILIFCSSSVLAQTHTEPHIELNLQDKTPKSAFYDEGVRPDAADAKKLITNLLKVNNISEDFVLLHTTKTPLAATVRYSQYYKGIKVAHGVYTAMVKNNKISLLSGNYIRPQYNESVAPVLTEERSRAKALEAVPATKYMWQNATMEQLLKKTTHKPDTSYFPKGSLVWCEDFSSGTPDRRLHLAYLFTVYAAQPMGTFEVFVDVVTGNILFKNSLLHHVTATGSSAYSGIVSFETAVNTTAPGGYVLEDYTRGNGIFTVSLNNTTSTNTLYDIVNSTTIWPVNKAIDAHWGAEKVYDYWLQKQGRNSYDDYGANLISAVDYDLGYDNAFWSGSAMFYGNGSGVANGGFRPLTCLDVCAHEIGHGVTQETAGLIYSGESGALNEGFSDIWGAVIEDFGNPHEVDSIAKNTWTIGEEIGATPMRSMKQPKLYGNPDTYQGQNWTPIVNCTGTNDECGVHNNSGVLNHWFYLLVNGGSGVNDLNNNFGVAGVHNMDSAATIAYYTELLLSPSATFADARVASVYAANTLFGACSKYTEAVQGHGMLWE